MAALDSAVQSAARAAEASLLAGGEGALAGDAAIAAAEVYYTAAVEAEEAAAAAAACFEGDAEAAPPSLPPLVDQAEAQMHDARRQLRNAFYNDNTLNAPLNFLRADAAGAAATDGDGDAADAAAAADAGAAACAPAEIAISQPVLTSFLRGLLERDSSARLGAGGVSELKAHPFLAHVEWELLRARKLRAPWTPDPNLVYAKDIVPPLSEADDGVKARIRARAVPGAARAGPGGTLSAQPTGAAAQGVRTRTEVDAVAPLAAQPAAPGAADAASPPRDGDAHASAGDTAAESFMRRVPEAEGFLSRWDYVCDRSLFGEELREWVRKTPPEEMGRILGKGC